MLDISLIFKIAGVGIVLFIIDKVLKVNGKEEFSSLANLVGIVVILSMVLSLVSNLFNTVKTMFML